jgi:hypothetical protein
VEDPLAEAILHATNTIQVGGSTPDIQMVSDPGLNPIEDIENIVENLLDPGSQVLEELSDRQQLTQGEPDIDLENLSNLAQLDDLKLSMSFVRALQNASLDNEILNEKTVHRLRLLQRIFLI